MKSAAKGSLSPIAAAATAAALCAIPETAFGQAWGSAGVAFSVSFGHQIEVGISMDARLTVLVSDLVAASCIEVRPAGLGPYGQAGWYSRTGWRFGAGVHGGGILIDAQPVSLDGEMGWSFRRRLAPEASSPTASPASPAASASSRPSPNPSPSSAEARPTGQVADLEVPGNGPSSSPRASAGSRNGSHGLHFGLTVQTAVPPLFPILGLQLPLGFDIPITARARGPLFMSGLGINLPTPFVSLRGGCLVASSAHPFQLRFESNCPNSTEPCMPASLRTHRAAGVASHLAPHKSCRALASLACAVLKSRG